MNKDCNGCFGAAGDKEVCQEENDMEDLKKCPFCGGKAEIVGYKIFWVICKECTAETKSFDTREEAIDAWNRRVE